MPPQANRQYGRGKERFQFDRNGSLPGTCSAISVALALSGVSGSKFFRDLTATLDQLALP